MYNAYFFYKQNFIYHVLNRFLSVKQIKTAFLRHSKTPAPVGNADSTGVFKQNIIFILKLALANYQPILVLLYKVLCNILNTILQDLYLHLLPQSQHCFTRDFCNMLHFSLLNLPRSAKLAAKTQKPPKQARLHWGHLN